MFSKFPCSIALFVLASPIALHAQLNVHGGMIKITIPAHSEYTPVQKLNREGVAAVSARHYEKAEGLFYKAYLFDPADPFTLNNLGYVAELRGDVEHAETFYRQAVAEGCYAVIDTSSAKTLKGKPMMDALGTLNNIPMRVNRINILGMQLLAQGQPFEAEASFKTALALDPANPFTLNNLGVADESIGDLDHALNYYDQAASTRSRQPVVVTLKRSARGKPVSDMAAKSASELRIRMSARSPEQIRAAMLTFRGVTDLNRNDWDGAKQSFAEAFSLDPQSAFALNNIGYVAEHDGDLETARSYYARALRAGDSRTRVGIATQVAAQGQRIESVADDSHLKVETELVESVNTRRTETRPVVLVPRNVDADEPAPDTTVPPSATPQPQAPQPPQ